MHIIFLSYHLITVVLSYVQISFVSMSFLNINDGINLKIKIYPFFFPLIMSFIEYHSLSLSINCQLLSIIVCFQSLSISSFSLIIIIIIIIAY